MKTIIFISIFITAVILPGFILASGDHNLSLEDILSEIMSSQNVDEAASINCQTVSDEQFEKLGDATMGIIHPDKQQHELMDQMMGGEGSESLKTMHIMMGKNYLGCSSGGGMMNSGMMSGGMMGGGMMGWNNWGLGAGWGWLGWVLIILGIIALIKWIVKK